jgi:hypothetical protein
VTRLAHDYGIPIHKPSNRGGHAIDRDWLYEQYITQHRSLTDIAQQCGLTGSTVARWAKIYGIPLRPKGSGGHVKTPAERRAAEKAPALLQPTLASNGGWDRLQRFADAARYPTLTVAAAELGLAQRRLVIQIKRVEHEIGHQLIIRAERGRRMQLTGTGSRVVKAVEKVRSRDSSAKTTWSTTTSCASSPTSA